MGTGRQVDGSRGGRKHAWPATQTAPADSRRFARPQLLAGYRALEPQQSLRTGPQKPRWANPLRSPMRPKANRGSGFQFEAILAIAPLIFATLRLPPVVPQSEI